jgi:hypothetical protein
MAAPDFMARLATLLGGCIIISLRQLMCTVSFVPKENGFHLAMNRDERRSRLTALPPAIVDLGQRRAVFPREPHGGTWIAANNNGACIALINWHRIEREPRQEIVSRGIVVERLADKSSSKEIGRALTTLPLLKLRPFRLIAIIPGEHAVSEWRWDLEELKQLEHSWKRQHWFSSGFDEAKAERERCCVCRQDRQSNTSIAGLRKLHRSHAPERGPFSICMHRDDAATVSYTEVTVEDHKVTMRYKPGPPCSTSRTITKSL